MTPFDVSGKGAFFKTLWEKEKKLLTSMFSFSHNVFYTIKDRNYHLCYVYFAVCKCFELVQGQIFVVWESSSLGLRIKSLPSDITLLSLDWSKFKVSEDDKFNLVRFMEFIRNWVENIVLKGKFSVYHHLPFL